jgi:hypothetical protein
MDRRSAARFRLRLVVALSWKDDSGVVSGCDGYSRDINSRGIYVQSEISPPLGAYVEMNVFLPKNGAPTRPVELHAEGRVVRIDPEVSPIQPGGFAAMNHTVVLRDSNGRIVDEKDSWDIELGGGNGK